MNKLLLAFILVVASISTNAATATDESDSFCESIMEAAEVTMRSRQTGVSAVEAIELANNATGSIRDMLREMIVKAYSSPRYSTDEYRKSAADDFATDYYIECIKHTM